MTTAREHGISRISKLFADRDQKPPAETMRERAGHAVTLVCGGDVGTSRTLQLSVLTAAKIADRCFPHAVRVVLPSGVAASRLLLWPGLNQSFGDALTSCLSPDRITSVYPEERGASVIFGDAAAEGDALRATFDGWIGAVGPARTFERLPERTYCSLAGVLAGALSVSEVFCAFAEINLQATRRAVGLSLWRPDVAISDPLAFGIPVEFLPSELWALGLGHLGNAYLWALATLPYVPDARPRVVLNDFDMVEDENWETSLLFGAGGIGFRKTRVCNAWLEARGFDTVLVERPFDSNFRCRGDEPQLAFCGFDTNAARRSLATANFRRVIESGLGGTADNFDTISLHALPNPRSPLELWPDPDAHEAGARHHFAEQAARGNPAYQDLARDECGRYELADKSVAVPFVGVVAATFVLAEALRVWHDGPAYETIKLTLSSPENRFALTARNYSVRDTVGLPSLSVG
jgi:hypothetical protein